VVPADKVPELFDLLDIDGNGQLSEEEFVQGILRLGLSDDSFDSLINLRLMKQMKKHLGDVLVEVLCTQEDVKMIQEGLQTMAFDI